VSPTHAERRIATMASGTIASRVTGLLRILVLAYVLGFSPLADAFNLANTVPNMLFDLVRSFPSSSSGSRSTASDARGGPSRPS